MAYLPLRNYKYDSGPHQIQSGPDHEGYILVRNGVRATGADNGIIVDGTPLSGVVGSGQRWGYDANWRYVPTSAPVVSGRLTLTLRQPSGTLGAYTYTRISTPSNIAGVKAVSSVESDIGFRNLNKRKSVYYGGACPDNQNYSPFNTPDGNTAAEGKTGGGVTHQLYESPLLTNVLGSQGTSKRSEWQYNSPIYCSVFTEAVRSEKPGLMSTVVRSTYRGGSLSYLANYGNVVLGAQQFSGRGGGGGGGGGGGDEGVGGIYPEEVDGGFAVWEEESYSPCVIDSPGLPNNSNEYEDPATVYTGDILSPSVLTGEVNGILYCEYSSIDWYRNSGESLETAEYLETGETYTVVCADVDYGIFYRANFEDVSLDSPVTDPVRNLCKVVNIEWFKDDVSQGSGDLLLSVIELVVGGCATNEPPVYKALLTCEDGCTHWTDEYQGTCVEPTVFTQWRAVAPNGVPAINFRSTATSYAYWYVPFAVSGVSPPPRRWFGGGTITVPTGSYGGLVAQLLGLRVSNDALDTVIAAWYGVVSADDPYEISPYTFEFRTVEGAIVSNVGTLDVRTILPDNPNLTFDFCVYEGTCS